MSTLQIELLHHYILQDDHNSIKGLIKKHPECINGTGSPSSVWLAVQYAKMNALNTLLQLQADPMLAYQGVMPIYTAAAYGNIDILRLLGKYMSVNCIASCNGSKAIDAAILYNRIDCIQYLLKQIPSKEELESLANKYTGLYNGMILSEGRRRARLVAIKRILKRQTQTNNQTELILPADVHPPIGNMIPLK